ncbi:DUF3549 family protein [Thalassotalea profundi]|uniref:DUF3549 family protein n=1 Tax=Thalassotalea profundi TaxID=2036687 RepID=A0ABQ3IJ58_9GAMM|nr:DUF3549 family protein [Thalassotalea profundi]GHE85296.1 hypothetical protein GCM10011501_12870 [Thalassotalea profundi]
MTTIDTISDLLTLSKSQYRIYDLGRKIDKISKEQFNKIESNQVPYPYPSQGHAHIAIAFWQKENKHPYLWFVKLPLDERGLLNQGARNHFIAIIIEALGTDLTVDPTEKQEELLKANPYNFTPAQYKLASLNSLLKITLNQAASQYYQQCFEYMKGDIGWNNWPQIGIQGLSDFACRLNDSEHQTIMINALAHLPIEVLNPLCCAVENIELPVSLVKQITDLYRVTENSDMQQAFLRALASTSEHPMVIALVQEILNQPSLLDEHFIVISGRNWLSLQKQEHMMNFLENLVHHNNTALFDAIFKDLVTLPTLRMIIFACMRDEKRSPALAKAIGSLFNSPQ